VLFVEQILILLKLVSILEEGHYVILKYLLFLWDLIVLMLVLPYSDRESEANLRYLLTCYTLTKVQLMLTLLVFQSVLKSFAQRPSVQLPDLFVRH
jgi:hypothetical protein